MIVTKTKDEIRQVVRRWKGKGLGIGFVPTMGFFHKGHLSLMEKSLNRTDRTIVSIFVNPTQFGPNEDFNRYPRDIERDISLAKDTGVHAVFIPKSEEMYPITPKTWVTVDELSKNLCGRSRPSHFRGVATVVAKLFNIIQPDVAVFGQKDFQQLQIIKQMVKDLDFPIEIVAAPIYREKDGLAMSSRNTYLSKEERKSATCLFKALKRAKELVESGKVRNSKGLYQDIKSFIETFPFTKIDYIFIGNPDNLEPVNELKKPLLVALAVYLGKTRLIDNVLII